MPDTPHARARRIVDLALGETSDAEHRCRPEDRVTVAHEVLVQVVANGIEAAVLEERQACADAAEAWAGHYPTDVFPEDGRSPDALAAKGCRLTCRNLADVIRKRGGE